MENPKEKKKRKKKGDTKFVCEVFQISDGIARQKSKTCQIWLCEHN